MLPSPAAKMSLLLLVSVSLQGAAGFNISTFDRLPDFFSFLRPNSASESHPDKDLSGSMNSKSRPEYAAGNENTGSSDLDMIFEPTDYEKFWSSVFMDDRVPDQLEVTVEKRPKLVPRIGRRKRSTTNDETNGRYREGISRPSNKRYEMDSWKNFISKKAVFIPKMRNPSITQYYQHPPLLKYKSRGSFIPRIG